MSAPVWRSLADDNVMVTVTVYDLTALDADPFKAETMKLLEVRDGHYTLDGRMGNKVQFERKPHMKGQDSVMKGATFPNNWKVLRPEEWLKIEKLVRKSRG